VGEKRVVGPSFCFFPEFLTECSHNCHPERSMTVLSCGVEGSASRLAERSSGKSKQKADLSAAHEDFRPHASVEMTELPVDEQEV
jgi:hypothetical protein